MHVLVVDNDLDTLDLVHYALNEAGYDVSQANGVADALRLSVQHPDIGVVISDMRLDHQITGMEMARKMRQRLSNGHYIFTCGDWHVLESRWPDDASILLKPYGKEDLLRAVRHGVARHQSTFRMRKKQHHLALLPA
jgi:DNA-binding NtrC family response regulator